MPDKEIRNASLEYHRQAPPGKLSVQPTQGAFAHVGKN
jgi:hypothetical protein